MKLHRKDLASQGNHGIVLLDIGMDAADLQNHSERRGRVRRRLVKHSDEDKGLQI